MSETVHTERNYGIDALRVLSMFMIVLLHVTGQGGLLDAVKEGTGQYYATWFVELSAFGAVNCYALISGYVGAKGGYRFSRLFAVWVQTVAYCIVITAFFSIFVPSVVSVKSWVSCIIPISSNQYWYITSYFGMFFLIPFLNLGINGLSRRQLGIFTLAALFFFMLLPNLTAAEGLLPSPERAEFCFNGGYSMIWLSILYIVGGFVGKYELGKNVGIIPAILLYLLSVIVSWLLELLRIESFFNYCSPFVFLSSLALLLLFSQLKFDSARLQRFISRISSTTLGVYLIHSHPLVWLGIIAGLTSGFVRYSPFLMCLCLLATALLIFFGSSLADLIRQWIFKLLRVDALARRLDRLLPW